MLASEVAQHVLDNGIALIRVRKGQSLDVIKTKGIHYDIKGAYDGNKKGWVYLDAFTASAIDGVYKALKPKTQEKFNCVPITKLIPIVWDMIK